MTSTGKHHKHPPLTKPALGEWGRREIAILGAPCSYIEQFAHSINETLGAKLHLCYVDADHSEQEVGDNERTFQAVFTDKIGFRRLDSLGNPSLWERRAMLSNYDLILVNGNHFTANEQIVLLHSKKRESLERKTDRLTNVAAVVEVDMKLEDYPFLQPLLQSSVKLFERDRQDLFLKWLSDKATAVPIQGLVLAGGHSLRMGRDKSSIDYHGIPQREHILRMFEQMKIPMFLSCRPDQAVDMHGDYTLIQDRITGMGPYGAILSAFMTAPDVAWLVVATDLPFVTRETLQQLIDQRNPSKIATAFHNPETGFPEPLITLWEPKAYPLLLSYLSQGNTCPRKALINSDVEVVQALNPLWLKNANTPEDEISIREQLRTSEKFSK